MSDVVCYSIQRQQFLILLSKLCIVSTAGTLTCSRPRRPAVPGSDVRQPAVPVKILPNLSPPRYGTVILTSVPIGRLGTRFFCDFVQDARDTRFLYRRVLYDADHRCTLSRFWPTFWQYGVHSSTPTRSPRVQLSPSFRTTPRPPGTAP